jgi:glycine/D-amino acid oxidase-like deaminating enzyme
VIGAGMIGVCVASYLRPDGHSAFLLDPGTPGEGASFGNHAFSASSLTPILFFALSTRLSTSHIINPASSFWAMRFV